jgi:hypothetical protein
MIISIDGHSATVAAQPMTPSKLLTAPAREMNPLPRIDDKVIIGCYRQFSSDQSIY